MLLVLLDVKETFFWYCKELKPRPVSDTDQFSMPVTYHTWPDQS